MTRPKPQPRDSLRLKFWGTRGSLPAPRSTTIRYGGNTPCVEVRAGGHVFIFDAGSGIRALGEALQREFPVVRATIFFSHYHWDHIHGFPFFTAGFSPDNRFVVYGEPRGHRSVKDILSGQMAMPYFPVPLDEMKASFEFRAVRAGQQLRFGSVAVHCEAQNHPGRCLSYRIEAGGQSLVYATDTEPDPEMDSVLIRQAEGADILIYDAQYTPRELRTGRKGWGHSSWQDGVRIARAARVRTLFLFHHEPSRDDRALSAIENAARREFPTARAAREGIWYQP